MRDDRPSRYNLVMRNSIIAVLLVSVAMPLAALPSAESVKSESGRFVNETNGEGQVGVSASSVLAGASSKHASGLSKAKESNKTKKDEKASEPADGMQCTPVSRRMRQAISEEKHPVAYAVGPLAGAVAGGAAAIYGFGTGGAIGTVFGVVLALPAAAVGAVVGTVAVGTYFYFKDKDTEGQTSLCQGKEGHGS